MISSISVGVKDAEFAFIEELAKDKILPNFITIDIAHEHSDIVIKMIKHIKNI